MVIRKMKEIKIERIGDTYFVYPHDGMLIVADTIGETKNSYICQINKITIAIFDKKHYKFV